MQTGMKGDFMEYQYITQANIDIGAVLITDSAVVFVQKHGQNLRLLLFFIAPVIHRFAVCEHHVHVCRIFDAAVGLLPVF